MMNPEAGECRDTHPIPGRARWVTFDCFGTLVDWHTGFAKVLKPLVGDRVAELLAAYHRFERELEADRPHRLYRDVLVRGLLAAARETGIPLSEPQARSLPASWGSLPVFPDVEEMLARLRARGYRLAVLTNCDEDLFAMTQRNFHHPFDLVVTAERVRDYKPSFTHFRHFAQATGVAASEWVHVACSFFHDIEPAQRLGIRRVWLDRDRTGEDPAAASLRVGNAQEVCEAVDELSP